jgi:hypothetical protein
MTQPGQVAVLIGGALSFVQAISELNVILVAFVRPDAVLPDIRDRSGFLAVQVQSLAAFILFGTISTVHAAAMVGTSLGLTLCAGICLILTARSVFILRLVQQGKLRSYRPMYVCVLGAGCYAWALVEACVI